jgi:hypothetical protein
MKNINSIFKRIFLKLYSHTVIQVVLWLRYKVKKGYSQEVLCQSYKKNQDKTFYVIRRSCRGGGLVSNFHHVVGHVIYARKNGWIPVVDMINYDWYPGLTIVERRRQNFWDRLFEQPGGYDLDVALESQNVILSSGDYPYKIMGKNLNSLLNEKNFKKISEVVQDVFLLKREAALLIEEKISKTARKGRTLAVFSRGTDYIGAAVGHNIMVKPLELISLCEKKIKALSIDNILISSEEEAVINLFRERFGERLRFIIRPRIAPGVEVTFVPELRHSREDDMYLAAIEYLAEIVAASRADYFLGGLTNGSALALELNNNKFLDISIIDRGIS